MAFDKLRQFVSDSIGPQDNGEENPHALGRDEETILRSYEEWGFQAAGKVNGLEMPFRGLLNLVREHFRKEVYEDEQEQQKSVSDAKANLKKREAQIEQKENEIKRAGDERIRPLRQKIEDLRKDIFRIRENPREIQEDRTGKASFVIGLLILAGLTVYLFVFYSSASFSALFKEFVISDVGMVSAIFDPNAIEIAYGEGPTEAILILTIPFIFIGLGYLVHKFQESKSVGAYFKVAALFLVTFIFDGILAYEITKKIYNLEKENLLEGSMPNYTVALAFQSVNFWLIIFAGFLVYVIWGFVFDFVMEAYDRLDIVKQAIKTRETEIKLHEADIDGIHAANKALKEEIAELKKECADFEKIASGDIVTINWNGYRTRVHEFTSGWSHWMNASKKPKTDIDRIHAVEREFVEKEWLKYEAAQDKNTNT